jgi:hypothetical protein
MIPSAIMSPTTATATPVEITPVTEMTATIPHSIPLIPPVFTTVIPPVLLLHLPVVAAVSYVISLSVPVILNTR